MKMTDNIVTKVYRNEWVSINVIDYWYYYLHQEKSDGRSVAFLIYREDKETPILGRYEYCPCHFNGIDLVSFTGMVDKGDDFIDAVITEIREEAGYICEKDELIDLGRIHASKITDTKINMYLLNATKKIQYEAVGDELGGEEGSYYNWISYEKAVMCDDPLMSSMIKRAEVLGFNFI